MKFIKSYKIFESNDTALNEQLNEYDIKDFIINENGSIDVNQNVYLNYKFLNKIPFKFNKISGRFNIADNKITSLENCPKYISEYFTCTDNLIKTLEGGPEYVGTNYYCNNNKLITLKGCTEEIYGVFNCDNNDLISLEFCPMDVGIDFHCSNNKLEYLDRSPLVNGNLYCFNMFKTEPEFNGHCEKLFWKKYE